MDHGCCGISPFADTFTDTAISSARVNGEHKEKVLQRWDGGDINGESYDLEADAVSCTFISSESLSTMTLYSAMCNDHVFF